MANAWSGRPDWPSWPVGARGRARRHRLPPARRGRFRPRPIALRGGLPPVDGISVAYAPRRTVLDGLLVDAAVAAGAELGEGVAVEELLRDGDAVVGIRGRSGAGR